MLFFSSSYSFFFSPPFPPSLVSLSSSCYLLKPLYGLSALICSVSMQWCGRTHLTSLCCSCTLQTGCSAGLPWRYWPKWIFFAVAFVFHVSKKNMLGHTYLENHFLHKSESKFSPDFSSSESLKLQLQKWFCNKYSCGYLLHFLVVFNFTEWGWKNFMCIQLILTFTDLIGRPFVAWSWFRVEVWFHMMSSGFHNHILLENSVWIVPLSALRGIGRGSRHPALP